MGSPSGAELAPLQAERPPDLRLQSAPPYALHPRPTGAVFYPVGYIYPGFYMAHGGTDPRTAEADAGGGGPLPSAGQQHNGGLGAPPHTIDALKARVMDAGPGEVKALIAASRLPLRAAAFTSLIQMAAKAKQPHKAVELFEAMSTSGVQPNTFSYSALISALARAGLWREAERYFDDLLAMAEDSPEMAPNTVTYAALISAYEKGGQIDKALAAFQQQVESGVPPDLITYSSLITACQRAGNLADASELLDQLHASGLVGSQQLYHGLLQACQAAGRWQLALEVFLGMQCASARPTGYTVSLLLGTLVAGQQVEHALWLMREALASGYDMPTAAFNNLLQLLAGQGDWERALAVHRAMNLASVRPDSTTAGLLVAACAQGGNQQLASQLAADFAAQGLLAQQAPPPPPARYELLQMPIPLAVAAGANFIDCETSNGSSELPPASSSCDVSCGASGDGSNVGDGSNGGDGSSASGSASVLSRAAAAPANGLQRPGLPTDTHHQHGMHVWWNVSECGR